MAYFTDADALAAVKAVFEDDGTADDAAIARALAGDTADDAAIAFALAAGDAIAQALEASDAAIARAWADQQSEADDAAIARALQETGPAPLSLPPDANHHRCPHCGLGVYVAPGEMNCTIFICGAGPQGQLPQHDERGAAELRQAGLVRLGCAQQFRYDGQGMVPCTGR